MKDNLSWLFWSLASLQLKFHTKSVWLQWKFRAYESSRTCWFCFMTMRYALLRSLRRCSQGQYVLASIASTTKRHLIQTSIHFTTDYESLWKAHTSNANCPQLSCLPQRKTKIKEWNGSFAKLLRRRYWILAILGSFRVLDFVSDYLGRKTVCFM